RQHKDCRTVVCGVCKNFGLKYLPINAKLLAIIRRKINQEFDLNEDRYPSVVCPKCRTALYAIERGHLKNKFIGNVSEFNENTNNDFEECNCTMCVIVKEAQNTQVKNKNAIKKRMLRYPSKRPATKKISLCSKCYIKLEKGKEHDCSLNQIPTNVNELLDENAKTAVTSNFLKSSQEKVLRNFNGKPSVLFQGPKGRPLLESKDLISLQLSRDFTNNDIRHVAAKFRTKHGRKSVEPHFRKQLILQSHYLDNFFIQKYIDIIDKDGKITKSSAIFCTDVEIFAK
ncbi:unnamed protein product, partial [Meganyctiphanes norvegica]